MKWTVDTVAQKANDEGLEPIQIDGIPDGFSWKEPDVTIGGQTHAGKYVLFGPLGSDVVRTETPEDLLNSYNFFING